ncbi:YtxH domain-containing protein [Clostridium sp. CCUG 7971]|uniref:YtxH domain-containing protein n=1 Tax=Clostridium sp. CCUG 7971 TaxID=2811414 RepID=UPI001ABA35E9|nr:YtxH domain-containing protein [Clostridium sp. CCUG 7971]MBO3446386.1 YtxH domain-containing protein [Clostridium sp. CCUG 7971]
MNLSKKIEEKRKFKQKEIRTKNIKVATMGLAAGMLTGAIGGIILAPKSGKETRKDIKEVSNKVASKVNNKAYEAKGIINEKINIEKENIIESKNRIKEYIDKKKNNTENEEIIEEKILLVEGSIEEKVDA